MWIRGEANESTNKMSSYHIILYLTEVQTVLAKTINRSIDCPPFIFVMQPMS